MNFPLSDDEILKRGNAGFIDRGLFDYRNAVDGQKVYEYHDALVYGHKDLPGLIYAGTQRIVCEKFGVGIEEMEAAFERCFDIIREYNWNRQHPATGF